MIFILHKDPQIAARRYKKKYSKMFIRVYLGYLIKAMERKYKGQLLLFDDYSDITNPYIRWLLLSDKNYLYLLFLTHYLIGKYERDYPNRVMGKEILGIDLLMQKSRPLFPKSFSDINLIPDEKGQTLNHYKNEIKKHRDLYNLVIRID